MHHSDTEHLRRCCLPAPQDSSLSSGETGGATHVPQSCASPGPRGGGSLPPGWTLAPRTHSCSTIRAAAVRCFQNQDCLARIASIAVNRRLESRAWGSRGSGRRGRGVHSRPEHPGVGDGLREPRRGPEVPRGHGIARKACHSRNTWERGGRESKSQLNKLSSVGSGPRGHDRSVWV